MASPGKQVKHLDLPLGEMHRQVGCLRVARRGDRLLQAGQSGRSEHATRQDGLDRSQNLGQGGRLQDVAARAGGQALEDRSAVLAVGENGDLLVGVLLAQPRRPVNARPPASGKSSSTRSTGSRVRCDLPLRMTSRPGAPATDG